MSLTLWETESTAGDETLTAAARHRVQDRKEPSSNPEHMRGTDTPRCDQNGRCSRRLFRILRLYVAPAPLDHGSGQSADMGLVT